MKSLSSDEAIRHYPHLARQVLAKLRGVQAVDVDPRSVTWHALDCHDDPDQPLDEAACADVMLTGNLPCRHGLCGSMAGHFACYCDEGCVSAGILRGK
ncbi:hypothetical protein [Telmatospirillum sp.]|uniref:hypothetical protein n=1 Tax=Telmatospirillum sp. TaxID=2079197 RepID=UPI00284DDECB|nr:hypothetical protein [Telmatospirillum sp.]MDR3436811.1 hypothetical protein [Telmatospirillum sp.]